MLALARVQRDAALSPTDRVGAAARLDRLADQLAAGTRAREQDWAAALPRCSRIARRSTRRSPIRARLPHVPPGMPIGMDEDL